MSTYRLIAAGVTALLTMLVLDSLWLNFVALPLFRRSLGDLLVFRWEAGVAFYLIYVAGLLFLAIAPAFSNEQWTTAAINGAALGFVAYATYEMTNLATLKPWTLVLALPDLAWGTVLTSVAATAGYLVSQPLLRLLGLTS